MLWCTVNMRDTVGKPELVVTNYSACCSCNFKVLFVQLFLSVCHKKIRGDTILQNFNQDLIYVYTYVYSLDHQPLNWFNSVAPITLYLYSSCVNILEIKWNFSSLAVSAISPLFFVRFGRSLQFWHLELDMEDIFYGLMTRSCVFFEGGGAGILF